jgi:Zn-dependent M28 family amino/carboxypeptidase
MTLEKNLATHVEKLAGEIGERNTFRPEALHKAENYIEQFWKGLGLEVGRQEFDADGVTCSNLWVEFKGSSDGIIVVGAHYDSVFGAPGANDNGSGVAALLEISRALKNEKFKHTVRFVVFPNEEPPHFNTDQMGSKVYADAVAKRKEKIIAMLSLETIGYFTDSAKSQKYPPLFDLFYPSTGNFLAIVGDLQSRQLVGLVKKYFKAASDFPVESVSAPRMVPGVGWSDQSPFWDHGYPAVMLTDTALYRYPDYHLSTDTPDKLNYPAFEKVVTALISVIRQLAAE